MITVTITGITSANDFKVYKGTTPFNTTFLASYSGGTTQITISNVSYGEKFYVVLENQTTGFRTLKLITVESGICETDVCDGAFDVYIVEGPSPTPTNTVTPTPSVSVSQGYDTPASPTPTPIVKLTATPTKTVTPSPTKSYTPTPTVTPTTSSIVSCGDYDISFDDTSGIGGNNLEVTYIGCDDIEYTITIFNMTTRTACIKEINGVLQFSFDPDYDIYVTINRIGNCYLP